MTFQLDQLKQEVRIALDENALSRELSALRDVPTLTLDELILSKIEPAALAVVQQAPVSLLSDVSSVLTGSLNVIGLSANTFCLGLNLPSDFLRLVRFQLSGWAYPVYEALPPSSPQYLRSHSIYGVCGTNDRPRVFHVPGAYGRGMLEIHSASSAEDTLCNCLYVKIPTVQNNSISLPALLHYATVYYAAYLVCLSINDTEYAEKMFLSYKSQTEQKE